MSRHTREQNRRNKRAQRYRALGGMTELDYQRILAAQAGGCAICRAKVSANGKRLGVDHSHATGAIRGLLCYSCNLAIGYMKDDPMRLREAADYLESGARHELAQLKLRV